MLSFSARMAMALRPMQQLRQLQPSSLTFTRSFMVKPFFRHVQLRRAQVLSQIPQLKQNPQTTTNLSTSVSNIHIQQQHSSNALLFTRPFSSAASIGSILPSSISSSSAFISLVRSTKSKFESFAATKLTSSNWYALIGGAALVLAAAALYAYNQFSNDPNGSRFRELAIDFFGKSGLGLPTPLVIILVANASIFLLWHVPNPRIMMMLGRWFTCSYHGVFVDRRYITLVTHLFSHESLFHLLFNCIGLTTVSLSLFSFLDEITFTIFYLTSGVLASLLGFAIDTATVKRGLLPATRLRPGLGASGAVFSLFALSCCVFPDTVYMIIFIPFVDIPATYAYGGALLFDLVGVYRARKGMSSIGHSTHLGGLMLGTTYYFTCVLPDRRRMAIIQPIRNRMHNRALAKKGGF